jgi:hypothetical protein
VPAGQEASVRVMYPGERATGSYLKESKVLAAQMSVPSMSRELSLLPFWKRWGERLALFAGQRH